MKPYTLQIKDYYALVNLHKILLEAKFHSNPDNDEVPASPFFAELYQEVASMLLQSEKGSDWESWLQLKKHAHYRRRAISQMKQLKQWKTAAAEEKKKIARNHLVPFLYTESELAEVVDEVEREIDMDVTMGVSVKRMED